MSDLSDAFLIRAQESLQGAESEFASGRYNNVANRAYYACFQAAIAALDLADIGPSGGGKAWDHGFVQSQFAGKVISRRKLYSADLRDVLPQIRLVRDQADYKEAPVSQSQASRVLARSRLFVTAVAGTGGPRR